MGTCYPIAVRIIAKRTLRQFWESRSGRADAKRALQYWYAQVAKTDWATPTDVKATYGDASVLKSGRVVFNICGNKYRLVCEALFGQGILFVKFIGTHRQYDAMDAETHDEPP